MSSGLDRTAAARRRPIEKRLVAMLANGGLRILLLHFFVQVKKLEVFLIHNI